MNTKNLQVTCGLLVGAGAALLAAISFYEEPSYAAASTGHVLPREAPLYGSLEALSDQLEDGIVRAQAIVDTAILTSELLQLSPLPTPQSLVESPLVWNGIVFGTLTINKDSTANTWEFRTNIAAPLRHHGFADETEITTVFRGSGGDITVIAASTYTHVHRTATTANAARAKKFVIGGNVIFESGGSKTQIETLSCSDDAAGPNWTSTMSDPERRTEGLETARNEVIAALLFSL